MAKIDKFWAREILDSRGIPTLEAYCKLDSGHVGIASVPSGTSTGTYEAVELRDTSDPRYLGKGVLQAVKNVNEVLNGSVWGMDSENQELVDEKLKSTDGTDNKSKYGANAILAMSIALSRAHSLYSGKKLFSWINEIAKRNGVTSDMHVPVPIFNMINGGLHGAGNLDFQEFWVIPASTKPYPDALRVCTEIYMTIGKNLERRGAIHSIGNEGGYAPNLFTNADALEVLVESIRETNYQLGRDVFLGLDVAADTFYKNGHYSIRDKSAPLNDNELLEYYKNINNQFHLAILEDPFFEDAWDSWKKILEDMGDQLIIVGDDLLVTNPGRVERAIKEKACNGILIKPNQIGTITETVNVIKIARNAGWKVIVSHRSGETNDTFIADFAVGVGSDYVKFGAPSRGERVAKYNHLLEVFEETKTSQ